MNIQEALAYMENIQEKLGSDYSLRDVKELAERAGHPEREIKVIHIAGTNGKGSVGTFISSILAASGYTVGRYISPSVFDYRERIQRISREEAVCTFFSEEEMAETITLLKGCCENMEAEGFCHPTAFEMETVMAFLLFQAWNVDIAVVECGLGGRLDATNIIQNPLLAVFTSISLDHMEILGNSVPEIAREKYGIIKENTSVVSKRQAECEALLREICDKNGTELVFMEENAIEPELVSAGRTEFTYKHTRYVTSQSGVFQLENAAIAIEAVKVLCRKGFGQITEETVKKGLFNSRIKGRFDLVSQKPFLLADGAHNRAAAENLRRSLEICFPDEKFSFVMGVFRDKEYEKILSVLLPLAKNIYTVTAPGARGLASRELCQCVRRMGEVPAYDCGRVQDALKRVLTENKGEKIIVCGSLSILKEVYGYFG